jgi:hypothetical protein
MIDQVQRQLSAHDDSLAIFKNLKWCAEHSAVFAKEQASGRQRVSLLQGRENTVFAGHIIGPGRQRPARRPSQDRPTSVDLDQVIEITEPSGELPRLRFPEFDAKPREIAGERSPILGICFRCRFVQI